MDFKKRSPMPEIELPKDKRVKLVDLKPGQVLYVRRAGHDKAEHKIFMKDSGGVIMVGAST